MSRGFGPLRPCPVCARLVRVSPGSERVNVHGPVAGRCPGSRQQVALYDPPQTGEAS